nr:MAG TPA: hypothetical protein [Caudoviricetes sp.]
MRSSRGDTVSSHVRGVGTLSISPRTLYIALEDCFWGSSRRR